MGSVSYENVGPVAVVTVDNAPVNALSQAIRRGLSEAFARFKSDDTADIAVIVGAGRMFIGGADISEFGKPPQSPSLPDVISQIEACDKPVVAAIHGMALGGGLEVALGAHYRIALPGTRLGLPEVKIGLIPGAGGTQRLPRIVGIDAALRMITSGTPVTESDALETGLIDQIGNGFDIREAALAYAQSLLEHRASPRPINGMPRATDEEGALQNWRTKLEHSLRGEVAPLVAVEAVEAAVGKSFAEGLKEERRLFQHLMDTPQRSGLVHAFFAERAVSKLREIADVAPRDIAGVGIIGGGTMGAGIATSAVLNGLAVTLVERDTEAAEKARATIARNLDAAVRRGKIGSDRRDEILAGSLKTVADYGALSDVGLVVEAVFESMDVKKSVFATLDEILPRGAILATNTSYLDVNEIAASTSRPEDVIGLHFFSPAHVMKLLEVVVADRTVPDVVATAFALAKRLGKTAVRAGVCDGFTGNRILSHYRTAADHMVLDGASPYQIDKALTDFGFAMGPYQVSDLAGLDIGYATRQRKAADAHPRDRYPVFADTLYHKGWLGQKTGHGYYIYEKGTRTGRPDPQVEQIIAQARKEAGTRPRTFTDDEIVHRYMAAMVNEGARVVEEGIAQRPLDVDVVFLYGYGFPRWRGGPMKYADMRGLDSILSDIRTFAETDDHFWSPAPLLEQLVAEGRNFDSLNQC
ncbi:3-hydroxyacyl-CoA dehydrogenase NAD-binding domain-containing protein [Salipiger bermudensis]|uniref:3-hydroxyacyl-CoA dehydrogenase NAD-binding domain-containing protein n=1 Tax=Salipiger bermudensis TaxID=344736 RepID=UPI001CD2667E|nr:3-hydroxyacyl-CoA dehydrogenase NAD-binding domain-containing protein [Salipiger bermudensis]MCA1288354.1 enoyl-CoA hydratase/isomerase family protein [Salipiger bermudensis]